nr:PREDICTED: IgGFc-binding protein-like [Opisthocomus hoazin]
MGTCVYQLAALCSDDTTLVPFPITVENNNRGSRVVSYTKEVTLKVYNMTLSLSQAHPQKLKVNDILVDLPFKHGTQLQVYISGVHGFIKTDFEVIVTFNWHSYARVILPNTYARSVCGLCGNADGNPQDDFALPDGQQAADEIRFADSWKVADVPGCWAGCAEGCEGCTEAEKRAYRGDKHCGLLVKQGGPFAACHGAVDPTSYFDDSLSCPPPSHYELCAHTCARACASLCLHRGRYFEDGDRPAVVALHLFTPRVFITVKRGKKVWVNGVPATLPVEVSSTLTIAETRETIWLTQKPELVVGFSPAGEGTGTGQDLSKRLCGICGNYNGDAADDLRGPDGKLVGAVAAMTKAWRAPDFTHSLPVCSSLSQSPSVCPSAFPVPPSPLPSLLQPGQMKAPTILLLLFLGHTGSSPVTTKDNQGGGLLYPFGLKVGDAATPREDDGMSPEIFLSETFYFYGHPHRSLYVNTFQAVLVVAGANCFVMFNYGDLQWTTGIANQGDAHTGLGGVPAQGNFGWN